MRGYLIAACVLFSAATFAAIFSNLFFMVVIGEVNRRRVATNQISYFWLTPWRFSDICTEYRRRCPQGRFLRYSFICFAAAVACALGSLGLILYATHFFQGGPGY
jgi:hypothetical protein